ncbi:hypothetical protein HHK36_014640 [Tetracentron sinense]|uniref:PB1 domain-containing protein n=1 Tax=Tetracentron sinense TaxID=13715 RepID=A0A834Z959_TETSI|nr:hypothetical protein HHK36_014640 [Tetracentron sinense]
MWLAVDTGEQGLQSLDFQALGAGPWMQQRVDPLLLVNEHNQQYQAMAAAALQDIRNGDPLKQQFLQFQQPFQYLQPSCRPNPVLQQQQMIQQILPQQVLHAQTQNLSENLPRHLLQQQLQQPLNDQQIQQVQQHQQTYQEAFQIPNGQIQLQPQLQQSPLPSPSCQKSDFTDSNIKFSAALTTSTVQNMLGSMCPEGSGNFLNFSKTGQLMMSEQQHQQSWLPKFGYSQDSSYGNSMSLPPFPRKDGSMEPDSCSGDPQTHNLFGVNIDSSALLLSTAVPSLGTSSMDADVSTMPFGALGFQSSLYGCMDDSSDLLHNAGQVDPPARTFVKVYKSGSVGRSLDISRFSSYHELRDELGQMFGIEGQLEDPLRSGWQLVFVDRENDVLLLGDDPWEICAVMMSIYVSSGEAHILGRLGRAFVNNVWCIKILSPEDVPKLGKQGVDSPNGGQRLGNSGCDARNLASGLPSVGSLEY